MWRDWEAVGLARSLMKTSLPYHSGSRSWATIYTSPADIPDPATSRHHRQSYNTTFHQQSPSCPLISHNSARHPSLTNPCLDSL